MTKKFNIYGDIVDQENDKFGQEDVCPNDFKSFMQTVEEGDEVEVVINSCGGSVTGGISIANMILALSKTNRTSAVVEGVAASIASVIACACDELRMGKSSFLMIHRVWGNVCGNCEDLRKEADVMEMMTRSLLSFYHRKFDLTDEQLLDYMTAETWISGGDAENFKLNAVVDDNEQVKFAAKLIEKISTKFNNKAIAERLKNMENNEETKEEVVSAEISAVPAEPVEEKQEETAEPAEQVEEKQEEKPSYEELEKKIEELEKKIDDLTKQLDECQKKLAEREPDEDVEKRVAKCQSTFQNKINNFKAELKAKDEELQKLKDSVSSLTSELDESKKELQKMSAAFAEKNNALAALNAGVLTPSKELPTFEDGLKNCKNLKERMEFITSGKYQ